MAEDDFPWADAARWSPGDEHGDLDWEVTGCIPDAFTLTARLGDEREARWSEDGGWGGDPEVVNAAQAGMGCMRGWAGGRRLREGCSGSALTAGSTRRAGR
ncbi:hypothetical protein ABQE48_16565 [Mycolicibacterium thermoresistibile]